METIDLLFTPWQGSLPRCRLRRRPALSAPSCRIGARLRLADNDDLTVIVPLARARWTGNHASRMRRGPPTRAIGVCVRTFLCAETVLVGCIRQAPHLLLIGRTATGCSRVN